MVGFDLIFTFAQGSQLDALKKTMGDRPVIVLNTENVAESLEQALEKVFSTHDVSTSHDEGLLHAQAMTWG